MINPILFFDELNKNGFTSFFGVPDSALKEFLAELQTKLSPENHVITANEGLAVAHAAGYHLATGRIGVVYLQNAGLGNIINPHTSLVSKEVYKIPVLYIIGWRGEPSTHDEPQHLQMGRQTKKFLKAAQIPFIILPKENKKAIEAIFTARRHFEQNGTAFAFLVKKDSFLEGVKISKKKISGVSREEGIKAAFDSLPENAVVISSTGKPSRELYEYVSLKDQLGRIFPCVGSMGHTSSIALEISKRIPALPVFVFEGDGSLLMHVGALSTIGASKQKNFFHIVFDNESHESVGGQPTLSGQADWIKIALGFGYKSAAKETTIKGLKKRISEVLRSGGPAFIQMKVDIGSRTNLSRPKTTPIENKKIFMETISRK